MSVPLCLLETEVIKERRKLTSLEISVKALRGKLEAEELELERQKKRVSQFETAIGVLKMANGYRIL